MESPKIFIQTARLEHEAKIVRAFEYLASAIATQNPELTAAQRRRAAMLVLADTANRIRAGEFTLARAITEAAMTEEATARQARAAYRRQRQTGRDETKGSR